MENLIDKYLKKSELEGEKDQKSFFNTIQAQDMLESYKKKQKSDIEKLMTFMRE